MVFSCDRHGSSSADKWTSVSPCLAHGVRALSVMVEVAGEELVV